MRFKKPDAFLSFHREYIENHDFEGQKDSKHASHLTRDLNQWTVKFWF